MIAAEVYSEVEQNRVQLTCALLEYVKTDTILFAFDEACLAFFNSEVQCVNTFLNASFLSALELDLHQQNLEQEAKILSYLDKLSLKKFTILYLTAIEIRSVLLAVLFVENQISCDDILQVAFYEEIYQQKKWGVTQEAKDKFELIRCNLKELKDENSLFEN